MLPQKACTKETVAPTTYNGSCGSVSLYRILVPQQRITAVCSEDHQLDLRGL